MTLWDARSHAWQILTLLTLLGSGPLSMADGETKDESPTPIEIPVSGIEQPELASFDAMFVELLREQEIPGAAVALVHDGQLVYARGFGWADREGKRPVEPTSLFRIASVSKPITGLAIMQLIERGKLKLDDKVVDILELDPELSATQNADPRWRQVTIRQLLDHTAGWDRDKSFDPMFRAVEFAEKVGAKPPAGPKEVIRAMLDVPFDFDPGTRYAYSNFGYCLLGRVVERVTAGSYEDYVRTQVLAPLAINKMQLGKTLLSGKVPGEVTYYDNGATGPAVMGDTVGKSISSPYGAWHLEAMDAHGAWIASVIDLARIAVALDKPASCPILSAASVESMFSPPPGPAGLDDEGKSKTSYYGCGWFVRDHSDGTKDTWHSGSLPGTSTIFVRRHDGNHFVVLFNTRRTKGASQPVKLVEGKIHRAINRVPSWPSANLFD